MYANPEALDDLASSLKELSVEEKKVLEGHSDLQLSPSQDILEKDMQNEGLKTVWSDLKEKKTEVLASFYKNYQKNKAFFENHDTARVALINALQDALRPKDRTQFELLKLQALGERLSHDIGFFIGRDNYLLENLQNTKENKSFAEFLETSDGKPFKEALVVLLRDKSTMWLPDVIKLISLIEPYTIGSQKSTNLWPDIINVLKSDLSNAQEKLSNPQFFVPQKTKAGNVLINKFKNDDKVFAELLEKKPRFVNFLVSRDENIKTFLDNLEKNKELRSAIDEEVVDRIVKAWEQNDLNKLLGLNSAIRGGLKISILKTNWPWQEDETEDE